MNKNISVIGLGHVGLCTAVCFAARGYKVISSDIETNKVELIGKGAPPFYEPELETMLKEATQNGNLKVVYAIELNQDQKRVDIGTPSSY